MPRPGAAVPPKSGARVVTAGMAWAQHTGLSTGTHTVSVRAVDQDGNVQSSERRPAIPGAATGLHERQFTVE